VADPATLSQPPSTLAYGSLALLNCPPVTEEVDPVA
jgi:hypothetical protein